MSSYGVCSLICPGLNHICVWLGLAPSTARSFLPTRAWELFLVGNPCDNTWSLKPLSVWSCKRFVILWHVINSIDELGNNQSDVNLMICTFDRVYTVTLIPNKEESPMQVRIVKAAWEGQDPAEHICDLARGLWSSPKTTHQSNINIRLRKVTKQSPHTHLDRGQRCSFYNVLYIELLFSSSSSPPPSSSKSLKNGPTSLEESEKVYWPGGTHGFELPWVLNNWHVLRTRSTTMVASPNTMKGLLILQNISLCGI